MTAKSTITIVRHPALPVAAIYAGDKLVGTADMVKPNHWIQALRTRVPADANNVTSETLVTPGRAKLNLQNYVDLISA